MTYRDGQALRGLALNHRATTELQELACTPSTVQLEESAAPIPCKGLKFSNTGNCCGNKYKIELLKAQAPTYVGTRNI